MYALNMKVRNADANADKIIETYWSFISNKTRNIILIKQLIPAN